MDQYDILSHMFLKNTRYFSHNLQLDPQNWMAVMQHQVSLQNGLGLIQNNYFIDQLNKEKKQLIFINNTQPTTSANLYSFDKVEMNPFTLVSTASCNTSTKTCTQNISSLSTTKAYLIGETAVATQSSTGRYYSRCRLGRFTWTGSSNSCA